LIACALAAGTLGARFVSHAARGMFVAREHTSRLAAAQSRGLIGIAS
jgi:hypothetical protein